MTTQPRAGKNNDAPAEPGTITIELKDPIPFGDEMVEELKMRPLQAGDLWDLPLEGLKMGDMLTIACKVSSTPPPLMKRASARDMAAIVGAINDQLAPLQEATT